MVNKTVYMHLNPSTQEVFYVGMGSQDRPNDFDFSRRSKQWISYVVDNGNPIVWVVKDSIPKEEAAQLEEQLILKYGRKGIDLNGCLVNQATGVGQKGVIYTKERNKKISENRMGFKFSKEARLKMSNSHKGKVLSELHKINIGKSISGEKNGNYKRKFSEETKNKLRVANLGKTQSASTIKKRMETMLLRGLIKNTKYVS